MIYRGLHILVLTIFLALPSLTLADSEVHEIIEDLQEQGYTSFVIEKTFLGRIRIIATDGARRRELIIHPFSKEVMRDRKSRDESHEDEDDDEMSDKRDDDRGDHGMGDD